MRPLAPAARTALIDVSSSSQAVLVTANSGIAQVRVMNNGSATAWIAFGTTISVAAAVATGIPIGPGLSEIFTVPDGPVYAAAIAAASTGKIYFTPGGN
jgi:hypothetical protein